MKLRLLFILLIGMLAIPRLTYAQMNWQQTGGPYGGEILSLAVNSSNGYMFAGSQSAVFISTNNGTSWTEVSNGLGPGTVKTLASSGTYTFAGIISNQDVIYRSTNNGTNWTASNNGIPSGSSVYSIAISGSNVFAATSNGVYRSTNNGTDWTYSGLSGSSPLSIAISGSNIFTGVYGGVYLSTNNGSTWTAVNSGLNTSLSYRVAINGTTIYLGGNSGGIVYTSTNNGTNWTLKQIPYSSSEVTSIAFIGSYTFASQWGGEAVYLTTDGGTTWTTAWTGIRSTLIYALVANGSNLYAGERYSGIYKTTNNGTNWYYSNNGIKRAQVNALTISGSNIFSGTYGNGVFLSTNNGTNWTDVNNGLPNHFINALLVSGSNIIATPTGRIYISTNNGTNWTMKLYIPPTQITSLTSNGSNIFAGSYGNGVYLSTNNGNNWNTVNTGLGNFKVNSVTAASEFIAAGTDSGVFISTNNGTNWFFAGLAGNKILSLTINGSNLFAGLDLNGGVYVTTNYGTNWTAANNGLTNKYVYALTIIDSTLFAGTMTGVFKSADNGANWVNTSGTNTRSFTFNDSIIFAGTLMTSVYKSGLPPYRPSNLTANSISSSQINLAWTAGPGTIQKYRIYRSLSSGSGFTQIDSVTAPTVTYNNTSGLSPTTTYYYRVYAVNTIGPSNSSNEVSATTLAAEPTAQPGNFSITNYAVDSMRVSYTAASGSPSGYIAIRSAGTAPAANPADGTTYSAGQIINGTDTVAYVGSSLTFGNTILAANTVYYYKIYSYNGTGAAVNYLLTSPLSGQRSTLQTEPANQPTGLSFTNVSGNSMTISYYCRGRKPVWIHCRPPQGKRPRGYPCGRRQLHRRPGHWYGYGGIFWKRRYI